MTTPPGHFISPKFQVSKASPGTFGDWVDIYEDRVWGWHLQHAYSLRTTGSAGAIAALHLAVAFVEPYEVFRSGKSSRGHSRQFFRRGFARIFNVRDPKLSPRNFEAVTDAVYMQIRCGLFHTGMTGTLVFLSNATQAMEVSVHPSTNVVAKIVLNPEFFVDAIINEFRGYVARLRNQADPEYTQLRSSFENAWHLVHRP